MGTRSGFITYTLNSPEIMALCAADERLAVLIRHYGVLKYTLHTEPFGFLVETIIGQMLSSKVADVITARLYELCGNKIYPETISALGSEALRGIGLSGAKAGYILSLAELFSDNPDFFSDLTSASDTEVIKRLTILRGIGNWSAKMYLIFVLNRMDVLPYEDSALLQSYKWLYGTDELKPMAIMKRCQVWAPYSSLAARYLYKALDDGLLLNDKLKEQLKRLPSV